MSLPNCFEDFDGEVLVKVNAIELLRKELASKRVAQVYITSTALNTTS